MEVCEQASWRSQRQSTEQPMQAPPSLLGPWQPVGSPASHAVIWISIALRRVRQPGGEPEQNPKGAADRLCAAPEATNQPWVGFSWRSGSAGAPACLPGRAAARPCKLHRLYTPHAATIAFKMRFAAPTGRHLAMQTPGRPVGGAGRRWRLRFGRPTQACAPLVARHLPAVCWG